MEIIMELLLTASVAIIFSFLISKIVSLSVGGDSGSGVEEKSLIDVKDEIIMEKEVEFAEKWKVQGFERENKVEFVMESADKVGVFGEVDQGFESEKKVECVQQSTEKVDEFEAGECGVVESLKVQGSESEKEVEFFLETTKKIEKQESEEIGEELEPENEAKVQSEKSQMKGLGEEEKDDDDDDDDWEGIERSEFEMVFRAAAKFVERKGDFEGLGNDVQMELYGLHKIATEGPCRESQPLAFMLSSRSKWNAWQSLGNMSPDAAMEQYVALLSDKVPGWMEDHSDGELKFESADRGPPGAMEPDINSFPDKQISFTQERSCRDAELKSATGGGDVTESTNFEKQAKD